MSERKVRIGIDVGGTFTHAVALDYRTYELVAHAVTPTTHTSKYSVSEGIIKVFQAVLEKSGVKAEDVIFVAHSTTQATNALLEGDVVKVGVIGMGKGMESVRAKTDTDIDDIELSDGKYLYTETEYLNSTSENFESEADSAVKRLMEKGCKVIVSSEAFGVDDISNEDFIVSVAEKNETPATASHEISQLYGLKVRTRTAVVNASILPKMTQTADMTNESIMKSGIQAPLMIMRSDGGVMDITQMRKRPILTLLSGPAAGIAAALMYVNISDGIFLEVGGTSTDISAMKNGKAMLKSASIGGHATYLKTLDSRTVGIGGGSMVRLNENGQVNDVGPRSAHIAGLTYIAFAQPEELEEMKVLRVAPLQGDPEDYVVLQNSTGKIFALTLTDAAMMAEMVKPGDYAYGNKENVQKAFDVLAQSFHVDGKTLAEKILDVACSHIRPVVKNLLSEYELDDALVSLVGGGGGCTAVVPWLGKSIGMKYMIAENAEVISAIGAAMAMLRDTVERTIINPTDQDISSVRRQAIDSLLGMGADANSIEVQMEIDKKKNIVRATAIGSIHMENQDFGKKALEPEELHTIAAQSFHTEPQNVSLAGSTQGLYVFTYNSVQKKWGGLIKKKTKNIRVLDQYGTIKLQLGNAEVLCTRIAEYEQKAAKFMQTESDYNDAGQVLPEMFLLYGNHIVDFSSVLEQKQVENLIRLEVEGAPSDAPVILLAKHR